MTSQICNDPNFRVILEVKKQGVPVTQDQINNVFSLKRSCVFKYIFLENGLIAVKDRYVGLFIKQLQCPLEKRISWNEFKKKRNCCEKIETNFTAVTVKIAGEMMIEPGVIKVLRSLGNNH